MRKKVIQAVTNWFDERFDLTSIKKFAAKKTVPIHAHTIWYYVGGMALFLFLTQVLTGILLLLYYRPTEAAAFESVQFIMTDVTFGWLIRSIHSWSANVLVGVLFIHLFSTAFMRAYRFPREITWVTGVLLFYIMLGFGFSGYLLPWNELAFFATKLGTEIINEVPFVGHYIIVFLRGGEDVTGATLTRFFGFHVAVLPAITTVLFMVHLVLVQTKGMSIPPGVEKQKGPKKQMDFFPNFILRDVLGWVGMLGLLAALGALFPWELGTKADLFVSAPADIRPEWYFVFMFETLKLVPASVLGIPGETLSIFGFGLAGAVVLLIPFLDPGAREGKSNPPLIVLGILSIIFIAAMTAYSYLKTGP